MKYGKSQRSVLRFPLDFMFSSPAFVRLMRVLVHELKGPVGVTEAARMAGLTRAGARKAFERLERASIVVRVGTGRAQKYGLKRSNPYAETLRQLFEQEQQQHDDLMRQLRLALDMPEIRGGWIEEIPLNPEDALHISVVTETNALSWINQELRSRLVESERRFNLIIETRVLTRADAPIFPEGAALLCGTGALNVERREPGAQSHKESAERSLRIARAITELMKSDPSLVQRALQRTKRLLHEDQGIANSDIAEWRNLLETYSSEHLRQLLVSTSSRAQRLRRSSPFFAVLTADERDQVLEKVEVQR